MISVVICFSIGCLTLLNNSRAKLNRAYFTQAVAVTIWQLGTFLLLNSKVLDRVDFWSRFTYIGAIFIPVTTFHVSVEFLQKEKLRRLVFLGYLLGIFVFLPLSWTNLFLSGSYHYYWGHWFKAGILHPLFILFFSFFAIFAFTSLYLKYKTSLGIEKSRAAYILVGTFIAYLGAVDFLPDYGIQVYPSSTLAICVYALITSYAIIKYRILDIEIAIKRTVIFGGLFAFVSFVLISFTYFLQNLLHNLVGVGQWLILLFSAPVIIFTLDPLKSFLTHITDRYLFQKKYDYQQTLKEASEGMTLVTDMKKLLNLIVRIVTRSIRVKSAAIFQFDETKNKYILKVRRGVIRRHSGYAIDENNVLIKWFKEHKETLLLDEIEDWLKSEKFLYKEAGLRERLVAIKEELLSMNSVVCVPSFIKGYLIGFLILGEKLSGDAFTQEDIRLLSTLSSEVAIAVENAKNFMEVEKLREKERESYIQTVLALAQTVDEKDSYTHGHLEDVSYYGIKVAEELIESSEFKAEINKEELETALKLHDIGKIGVPDAILNKNGKLTSGEWAIMKQHCEIGARIVEPIEKLRNVGNVIKHHQEKYDGTGYPDGLKGEEIPLESRIIAVVDSYHAMTSDRPYRKALSEDVAIKELKNNIGKQFDPIVVAAFIRAREKGKIEKI